jgi:hypothetical protein
MLDGPDPNEAKDAIVDQMQEPDVNEHTGEQPEEVSLLEDGTPTGSS